MLLRLRSSTSPLTPFCFTSSVARATVVSAFEAESASSASSWRGTFCPFSAAFKCSIARLAESPQLGAALLADRSRTTPIWHVGGCDATTPRAPRDQQRQTDNRERESLN